MSNQAMREADAHYGADLADRKTQYWVLHPSRCLHCSVILDLGREGHPRRCRDCVELHRLPVHRMHARIRSYVRCGETRRRATESSLRERLFQDVLHRRKPVAAYRDIRALLEGVEFRPPIP